MNGLYKFPSIAPSVSIPLWNPLTNPEVLKLPLL